MKSSIAAFAFLVLLSLQLFAQGESPFTRQITAESTGTNVALSGKVITDDGSAPPGRVAVQSQCGGQVRTETYTTSDGSFMFTWNGLAASGVEQAASFSSGPMGGTSHSRTQMQDCDLSASLAGYVSEKLHLSGVAGLGPAHVGNILLHHAQPIQGTTVSVTSLAAPVDAKKSFSKGREEERKGKWTSAAEKFQKAIAAYPKYADAWLELGRVQEQLGDTTAARESFRRASDCDSKLLEPYEALSNLAIREQQWQELAETTDQLLQVNPAGSPQVWFYNSIANYNLHQFNKAEKSDLRGIMLDHQHHFPKMEYLLGLIMAVKHEYRAAAEHIRSYLKLSPNSPDASVAQKQLADLERLSADTTVPNQ